MALNSDYYRHIRHVLGDAELSGLLSEGELLMQSADWMSSAHPWQFLVRPLRLSVRASISLSDASYVHATRTLTKTGAFALYSFVPGDRFSASAGTGVTLMSFPVESRTDDDSIVLATPGLGAAADLQVDIDGILPNDSIGLPADFMAFPDTVPLRSRDTILSRIQMRSREVLTALRTRSEDSEGAGPWVAAVSELVDPVTLQTSPVLELHPFSSIAVPDAFVGYYRARIAIDTSDERKPVPLPSNRPLLEAVLKKVCRIFALGYEEGEEVGKPTLEMMLSELMLTQLWKAAKKADGLGHAGTLGPLRGGIGTYRTRGWGQTRNLVDPPS